MEELLINFFFKRRWQQPAQPIRRPCLPLTGIEKKK